MTTLKLVALASLGLFALGSTGCYGETIEPGHRGLAFNPRAAAWGTRCSAPATTRPAPEAASTTST